MLARLSETLTSQDTTLSTIARFLFAAILAPYFWVAALTKIDGSPLNLTFGAYGQIFPRQFEAVGYDIEQMGLYHHIVVYTGTWAEFLLPALIIAGLFTRLAALGMITFVVVQSLTDLVGHGAWGDGVALGAWFDKNPSSMLLDQRMLWLFLLAVLVIKGAGRLSLDALLWRHPS